MLCVGHHLLTSLLAEHDEESDDPQESAFTKRRSLLTHVLNNKSGWLALRQLANADCQVPNQELLTCMAAGCQLLPLAAAC